MTRTECLLDELFTPPAACAGDLEPASSLDARRVERFVIDLPALLLPEEGETSAWPARIRDLSAEGMRLTVFQPVPQGRPLRIQWRHRIIRGRVCYQRVSGGEYVIGMELFASWEALVGEMLAAQTVELRASNVELERRAEALRRQADLLDLAHDAIFVVGIDGVITFWNDGAERMYGWSREEALGRDTHLLLESVFPEAVEQIQRQLVSNGRWEGELRQRRRNGEQMVVASRWALQRDSAGHPAAILSINSDVTARKRAEGGLMARTAELMERNRELRATLEALHQAAIAKDRFLANMSHELRTPLNGIIGFGQMLHDGLIGQLSGTQQECLSDILGCANHLLGLINDVLDLEKIKAGGMEFADETIQIDEFAGDVIDSLAPMFSAKGISVSLQSVPEFPAIRGDARRLRQVLYNFLSNALKFTNPGGRVMVRVQSETIDYYRLEVEDDGIGISPEDVKRLFCDFEQLCSPEKAREGAGLGLSVSRRIVEAQGGRVGVESTLGAGSRFYAILPKTPQRRRAAVLADDAALRLAPPGTGLCGELSVRPSRRRNILPSNLGDGLGAPSPMPIPTTSRDSQSLAITRNIDTSRLSTLLENRAFRSHLPISGA